MSEKKLHSSKVLERLIDYLVMSLEELMPVRDVSQFSEGTITAFVECLEIVSVWTKFHKYGINDIEERFPIR